MHVSIILSNTRLQGTNILTMEEILNAVSGIVSEERVLTVGSVTFPSRILTRESSTSHSPGFGLVMGHGLAEKSHDSDEWTALAVPAVMQSQLSLSSITYYTARGHGETSGWEALCDADPDQFMWPRLAEDMIGIADAMGYDQCVVGGESMGSSTAFFTALHHPERVKAVIMMRPPTAWETRAYQRDHLERKAKQFEESPSPRFPPQFHKVLRATAKSDYPPLEGPGSEAYAQIQCPVLLLAVENDPVHPVSTSVALNNVLPNSELLVVADLEEAKRLWPSTIAQFLNKVVS